MKQKGCAASRAEQKLRFPENTDARGIRSKLLFCLIIRMKECSVNFENMPAMALLFQYSGLSGDA